MTAEYSIQRINRPSERLSAEEKADLVPKLVKVTRDGFGTAVTDEDIENHVLRVDYLYLVLYNSEGPVGFGSFDLLTFDSHRILYYSGTVFAKRHQRKGLMGMVLDRAIADFQPNFAALRTQNPAVYVVFSRRCECVYPNGSGAPPEQYQRLALEIVERRRMAPIDPTTFVNIGTYGGCMTAEIPCYRGNDQEKADAFARIGLVVERGDSVLVIGKIGSPLS